MLLVLDTTVPGPKIRFKRPRFRLKCVLNSIVIPAAQLLSFAGLSCCAQPALSGGPGGPWPLADARGPAIDSAAAAVSQVTLGNPPIAATYGKVCLFIPSGAAQRARGIAQAVTVSQSQALLQVRIPKGHGPVRFQRRSFPVT